MAEIVQGALIFLCLGGLTFGVPYFLAELNDASFDRHVRSAPGLDGDV